jgi:hypothetical protein
LRLPVGTRDLFVDLGAERLLAAERGGERIAVEVKSFSGVSLIADLEWALGQYILYHDAMWRLEPDRRLYLAVDTLTYADLFQEPIGQMLLENNRLLLLIFSVQEEEIQQWIPPSATAR